MCICVVLRMLVQVPPGARGSDILELQFQMIVSHLMRELGTELGSSGRIARTLDH